MVTNRIVFARFGEPSVTVYMPILKGRNAELRAVEQIPPDQHSMIRPLIEVMDTKPDRDDVRARTLQKDAADFADSVRDRMPPGMVFAVDCRHLIRTYGRPDNAGAMAQVSAFIHMHGHRMIPVFQQTDDPEDRTEVGQAAATHGLGACLRLPCGPPRRAADAARLSRLVRTMGLGMPEVDLVLDLWAIKSDHDLRQGVVSARQAIAWACGMPWRSITLAGGAFPREINDLPFDTSTSLPRREALVWTEVVSSITDDRKIGYADYGVSHPRKPPPYGRAHPNLRYTVDECWEIYRCAKRDGGGGGALGCFRDLCKGVIASDHWPPQGTAFSWGDQQIERFAAGMSPVRNDPASWRAIGMSHHFAVVVDRLCRLKGP